MRIALVRHALTALAAIPLAGAVGPLAGAAPAREAGPAAPTLVGVVQDSAGRPLPGVQVVVLEANRSTTTGADGRFVFRSLRPGTYRLEAALIGYAPARVVVRLGERGPEEPVTITLRLAPVPLSTLHVTASPAAASPLHVAQATTELAGSALARTLGASVAQTLATQPGMATRYAGPAASAPILRGLSGERVLVLQDGQRVADLSATSPDHALSVDPLDASRLEVVRGPASLLYGNNALGGVVNVISNDIPTAVPHRVEGHAAVHGESATRGGGITGGVTLPLGPTVALAARGAARWLADTRVGGGGVLENSDARNRSGGAALAYVREALAVGAAYRIFGFRYGLPTPPDAEEAAVHIEGQRRTAQLRAELALGEAGLTRLRFDGTAQWYAHDEVEPEGTVGSRFKLRTQTFDATARTAFGRLEGAVGVAGLFRRYDAVGEEALTPGALSRSLGAFAFQELPLGPAGDEAQAPRLQLGARYDTYRIESRPGAPKFGPARSLRYTHVSGSVGASVPLGPGLSLGISAARAFRAPTVEELFSNGFHAAAGSYDVGNADLEPETNQGLDAVLRLQSRKANGQLSAYSNRIHNFIAPQIVGDTLTEEGLLPLNRYIQRDATLRGLEAQIEAEVAPHIVLGALADVVRGEFRDGEPLPFMPAARIGASARWDNGRLSLGAEWRHAFRQDRVPEHETVAEAYTLVNLSAGANLIAGGRVHTLTLRVENLLDARYREATSRIKAFAPNPGRNASLVYRILF